VDRIEIDGAIAVTCDDIGFGPEEVGGGFFAGRLRGSGGFGVVIGVGAAVAAAVAVSMLLMLLWSIVSPSEELDVLEVMRLTVELREESREVEGVVGRVGTVGLPGWLNGRRLGDWSRDIDFGWVKEKRGVLTREEGGKTLAGLDEASLTNELLLMFILVGVGEAD